jgi:hypothetical protein
MPKKSRIGPIKCGSRYTKFTPGLHHDISTDSGVTISRYDGSVLIGFSQIGFRF